jgi:hypothetical protein
VPRYAVDGKEIVVPWRDPNRESTFGGIVSMDRSPAFQVISREIGAWELVHGLA